MASPVKRRRVTVRQRALEYVRARGATGATPDEFAENSGLLITACRPRFCELSTDGLITPSGQTRRYPGNFKDSIVWLAV